MKPPHDCLSSTVGRKAVKMLIDLKCHFLNLNLLRWPWKWISLGKHGLGVIIVALLLGTTSSGCNCCSRENGAIALCGGRCVTFDRQTFLPTWPRMQCLRTRAEPRRERWLQMATIGAGAIFRQMIPSFVALGTATHHAPVSPCLHCSISWFIWRVSSFNDYS